MYYLCIRPQIKNMYVCMYVLGVPSELGEGGCGMAFSSTGKAFKSQRNLDSWLVKSAHNHYLNNVGGEKIFETSGRM